MISLRYYLHKPRTLVVCNKLNIQEFRLTILSGLFCILPLAPFQNNTKTMPTTTKTEFWGFYSGSPFQQKQLRAYTKSTWLNLIKFLTFYSQSLVRNTYGLDCKSFGVLALEFSLCCELFSVSTLK